jgi:hypothetical protein
MIPEPGSSELLSDRAAFEEQVTCVLQEEHRAIGRLGIIAD